MIRAMLAAYRRTLQKTMAQARSMQQVVDEAGLDWLETPDQAVVWGTALGLQGEIEEVLKRSLEDVRQQPSHGVGDLLPGLVRHVGRVVVRERHGRRQRRQHLLGLGRPGPRRDDVGTRHDRELAVVVGERRRRVQRRFVGRRRRRLGRRVLATRRSEVIAVVVLPSRSEQVPARLEPLDLDRWPRPGPPASSVIRKRWVSRDTPCGASAPRPLSS